MAKIKGFKDIEFAKASAKTKEINTGESYKVVKRAGYYFIEKDLTKRQKAKKVTRKIGELTSEAKSTLSGYKHVAPVVRPHFKAQPKKSPFISKSGQHIAQERSPELISNRTATHPSIRAKFNPSQIQSNIGVSNRGFVDIPRMQ